MTTVVDSAALLAPDSRIDRALISMVTENGFEIVRLGYSKDPSRGAPGVHCFVVRAPNGDDRDVTVEFAEGAIALIQRKRSIPLSSRSSFWIESAERSLGTYLWQRTKFPPDGRFIIDEVCLNELAVAGRWDDDPIPDLRQNKSRYRQETKLLGRNFYLQSRSAVLSLFLIAALALRILTPEAAHLRDATSVVILYTAIFLSGALVGLIVIHFASGGRVRKVVASATNRPDRVAPSSYDEEGRTPVERVIHSN